MFEAFSRHPIVVDETSYRLYDRPTRTCLMGDDTLRSNGVTDLQGGTKKIKIWTVVVNFQGRVCWAILRRLREYADYSRRVEDTAHFLGTSEGTDHHNCHKFSQPCRLSLPLINGT